MMQNVKMRYLLNLSIPLRIRNKCLMFGHRYKTIRSRKQLALVQAVLYKLKPTHYVF